MANGMAEPRKALRLRALTGRTLVLLSRGPQVRVLPGAPFDSPGWNHAGFAHGKPAGLGECPERASAHHEPKGSVRNAPGRHSPRVASAGQARFRRSLRVEPRDFSPGVAEGTLVTGHPLSHPACALPAPAGDGRCLIG